MQALPSLNARAIEMGLVALIIFVAWNATQTVASKVNAAVNDMTKPAANVLSDFLARFNGWEPVTLAPLMIRDFYLTADKRLTAEAEQVLWKIDDYYPFLVELFGVRGGALKPQYYELINVEITQRTLQQ